MIFEYMPNRDLHDFLRQRAPNDSELSQLLSKSIQVARGLAYLAEKRYIHRDTAARNVLLRRKCEDNFLPLNTEILACLEVCVLETITDSEASPCYQWDGFHRKLLLTWLLQPPVTFTLLEHCYGNFLFSQPYENVSNEDVVDHILQQELLKEPIGCPNALYGIMKQCWNYQPKQWASAHALIELLQVGKICNFTVP